ncbi:MAG TPA: RNB domain-containing ribonuclease [Candidatus Cloacimonas sp.]|nr:RNB domain-containing ribonuclease [Candidatus Cloacimonas sp.]
MFNLASGKIVLFFQDGNLQSGIITEAQNRHYKVLNQEAKTYILPPARFILVTQKVYEPVSTKTLEDFEKQIKNKIEEEGENWLLQLQETQDSFTFEEICSKFGLEGDIERFALFILLQQRKDLFKFKKDVFSFRNEEERLKYLQEEAETRERTRYLKEVEKFLQTYQDLLPSLNILSPIKDDVSQGFDQDSKTQFLSELRELLRSNTPKDLAKLLRKYSDGLDLRTLIRNIRLLLRDISPDTDKIAADSGIPINFSSEILRESQKLQEKLKQEAENQNVTNLEAFTIDAIDSPDYDDAISLQKQEQGWILGIHISDVGGQLPLNSSIFKEACERVSSLYLPCETIPLLPPSLSKEAFSLKAGEKRKVLSLYLFMDKEFKIEKEVFKQEYITVKQNLSYEEVDRYLTSHQNSTLLQIVHHIHKGRQIFESSGKRRYEWNVVCKNGELAMECIDFYSPARLLIEELMVLYNRTLAEYASAKGLPCIYRNIAQYEEEEGNSHNYCQAFLSTKAAFHPGIGSRAYLHCSSPIRRVTDIINQAQFEALLNQNRPPFSEEELIKLIPAIEERVSYLHSVAARSEHYWFLRFLQQKYLQRTLDAILIRSITDGYIIELTDWDKHIFLKSNEILPLHHSVKLILTEVNPDEDWVKGEIIV